MAMSSFFDDRDLIFAGMSHQGTGQKLPLGGVKTKTQEKLRLAAAGGMRWI